MTTGSIQQYHYMPPEGVTHWNAVATLVFTGGPEIKLGFGNIFCAKVEQIR